MLKLRVFVFLIERSIRADMFEIHKDIYVQANFFLVQKKSSQTDNSKVVRLPSSHH